MTDAHVSVLAVPPLPCHLPSQEFYFSFFGFPFVPPTTSSPLPGSPESRN